MSSINIDLSVLKEEVITFLRASSRFINSSILKMRNINLPDNVLFKQELEEINELLDTIKINVTNSIDIINDRVQIFNQVEKNNQRFLGKINNRYNIKEIEVEASTAEQKVEQVEQIENEVKELEKVVENKPTSQPKKAEIQNVEEVKEEPNIIETAGVITTDISTNNVAAPILAVDNVEKETQAKESESFLSRVGDKLENIIAWLKQRWNQFWSKWNDDKENILLPNWEMPDKTSEQIENEIKKIDEEGESLVEEYQDLYSRLILLYSNNASAEEIEALENEIEILEQQMSELDEKKYSLLVAQKLKSYDAEILKLTEEIESLENDKAYIENQINDLSNADYMGAATLVSLATGTKTNEEKLYELRTQLGLIEKQIESKKNEKNTLMAEKSNVKRQLNEEFYFEFTKNEDFEKYSNIDDKSDLILSDEYIECIGYLTEYEEKMYAYLQRTSGEAASNEYLSTIRSVVNYRKGYDQAVEFLQEYLKVDENGNIVLDKNGNPVYDKENEIVEILKSAGGGILGGSNNFFENIENYFKGITGDMDIYLSPEQYKQMIILQNLQMGDKTVYEIFSSIGNMATPMLVGTILPGGGSIVASVMMGVSSAGGAWKQAYSETITRQVKKDENGNILTNENGEYVYEYSYSDGVSFKQALLIGHATGASEAVLGHYLGKIPGISKMDKVKVDSLKTLLKSVAGKSGSEAIEEGTQYLIGQVVEAAVTGKPVEINAGELLKNAGYGAITAGILNGGQAVVKVGQNVCSLNIDLSRINDHGYIKNVNDALNFKFNGTIEGYNNLSDDAKMIVDGLVIKSVTTEQAISEVDTVETLEQENDNISLEEMTSKESNITNNSQPTTDFDNTRDIYSYSDHRSDVGAEFHGRDVQTSGNSDIFQADSDTNETEKFDSITENVESSKRNNFANIMRSFITDWKQYWQPKILNDSELKNINGNGIEIIEKLVDNDANLKLTYLKNNLGIDLDNVPLSILTTPIETLSDEISFKLNEMPTHFQKVSIDNVIGTLDMSTVGQTFLEAFLTGRRYGDNAFKHMHDDLVSILHKDYPDVNLGMYVNSEYGTIDLVEHNGNFYVAGDGNHRLFTLKLKYMQEIANATSESEIEDIKNKYTFVLPVRSLSNLTNIYKSDQVLMYDPNLKPLDFKIKEYFNYEKGKKINAIDISGIHDGSNTIKIGDKAFELNLLGLELDNYLKDKSKENNFDKNDLINSINNKLDVKFNVAFINEYFDKISMTNIESNNLISAVNQNLNEFANKYNFVIENIELEQKIQQKIEELKTGAYSNYSLSNAENYVFGSLINNKVVNEYIDTFQKYDDFTMNLENKMDLTNLNFDDKKLLLMYLESDSAKIIFDMDKETKTAFYAYTGAQWKAINEPSGNDFLEFKNYGLSMDNFLQKCKLKDTQLLQRNATISDLDGFSVEDVIGKTLVSRYFRSTCYGDKNSIGSMKGGRSAGADNKAKIKIDYILPPGASCIGTDAIFGSRKECEVVIARNQKIKYLAYNEFSGNDGSEYSLLALVLPERYSDNTLLKDVVPEDFYNTIKEKYPNFVEQIPLETKIKDISTVENVSSNVKININENALISNKKVSQEFSQDSIFEKVELLNANPADNYKRIAQNNTEVGLYIPSDNKIEVTSNDSLEEQVASEPQALISSSFTGKLEQVSKELDTVKNKFDTNNAIPVDFVEVDDVDTSSSTPLIGKTSPDFLELPSSSFGGMLSEVMPGTMAVFPSIFDNVEKVVVDATNINENQNQSTPQIETLDDMSWLDDDKVVKSDSKSEIVNPFDGNDLSLKFESAGIFEQLFRNIKDQSEVFNDVHKSKKNLYGFLSERIVDLEKLNTKMNDVVTMINSFKRYDLDSSFAKKTIDALESGVVYMKEEFKALDFVITFKTKLQDAQSNLLLILRELDTKLQNNNQEKTSLNETAKKKIEQINLLLKEIAEYREQLDKLDKSMESLSHEIKNAENLNREVIETIDSNKFLNPDEINASSSLLFIIEILKRQYHNINNDLSSLDSSIDRIDRMIKNQGIEINKLMDQQNAFLNNLLKDYSQNQEKVNNIKLEKIYKFESFVNQDEFDN